MGVKGNEDTDISSRLYCLIWPKFAGSKCLEVGNEMCNRLNACVSPNFICQNPTLPNVIILGSGALERRLGYKGFTLTKELVSE